MPMRCESSEQGEQLLEADDHLAVALGNILVANGLGTDAPAEARYISLGSGAIVDSSV